MQEEFPVTCPYCGERLELYLEAELEGTLIQDCEVCCNPWEIQIRYDGGHRQVSVTRADGTE